MSHNEILLSDGQIYQIIERVRSHKILPFLKLGTEASTEAFTLLSVGIRMMTCILTQVVESLGILQYITSALRQCQEFIEFSIDKTSWNMMSPESIFELILINHMISQ